MKKAAYLFIIALVLIFVSPKSFSQEAAARKDFKFTIKTNPFSALGGPFWAIGIFPITGEYKLLGEYAFAKKMSFQLGASYIGPSALLNLNKLLSDSSEVTDIKTSGFKITGMYKYFISRDLNAPEGFYVAPHFSFATAKLTAIPKVDTIRYSLKPQKININICLGYQMITSGGFTLDIFTGIGYVSRKWNYEGKTKGQFDLGKDKSSISIPFGFYFGYAF